MPYHWFSQTADITLLRFAVVQEKKKINEWCFRKRFCAVVILSRGQWDEFLYEMLQMQDQSLDLLTCSPARYHCTSAVPLVKQRIHWFSRVLDECAPCLISVYWDYLTNIEPSQRSWLMGRHVCGSAMDVYTVSTLVINLCIFSTLWIRVEHGWSLHSLNATNSYIWSILSVCVELVWNIYSPNTTILSISSML